MRIFTVKLRAIGCVLLALVALACGVGAAYVSGAAEVYFSGSRSLPIYSVEREDKKISISFDCAWGTEHTDAILEGLKNANVKATFFMVEFWTRKYPEYVQKIDGAGHEIGTHSSTHSYMSKLGEESIRGELKSSSEAIRSITEKRVELFRPPYGDYDNLLIDTCSDMGIYPIQWDVDSLDWKDLSAKQIAERIVSRVKSGSIILCHNNGLHTAEAVPIVVDALRAKGYEFVPIGELIYRQNYTVAHDGRQHAGV